MPGQQIENILKNIAMYDAIESVQLTVKHHL